MKKVLCILTIILLCGIVRASDITAIFDPFTRVLDVSTNNLSSSYCYVKAGINRHGHTIPFKNSSFGFTASTNGVEFASKTWPPAGVKYVSTDQDILETARVMWEADAVVTFNFWLNSAGESHSTNLVVTVPRPPKPYPSWHWDAPTLSWQAPVPYPDDGKDYVWDEANQKWVLVVY